MFRNVRFYRVSTPWPESEHELSDILAESEFKPCGPLTERRSGWESPSLVSDGLLCRRVGGADLLQLRTQSRLLPAAAIQEALVDRVNDFKSRMQQDPSRRVMRRLKDETRDELLPKSLLKSERMRGFFLLGERLLGIDAASENKAERFLDQLRAAFKGFEFTPVSYNRPLGDLMTAIFLGEDVAHFTAAQECRMRDLSEKTAVATWKNINLADPSIRQHVVDGMKLTHLAVEYDHLLSCVVSEEGVISKLRFADGDAADVTDEEDPLARQDSEFVLLTGIMRRLITDFEKLLDGFASAATQKQANAA